MGDALRAACSPPAEPLLLKAREPVAVYGAGRTGRDVLDVLVASGAGVRCVLDRDPAKRGRQGGVEVHDPDDNLLSDSERAALTVVIGVFNPDADPGAIRASLLRAGYGRVVGFQRFHREFAAGLGDRYWLTLPAWYAAHEREIRRALDLWADEKSRDLYSAVLGSRLYSDESLLPAPSLADQYFPSDLPPLRGPIHLVDCGAYIGDTIADAMARGTELAVVCAFEPDGENFARLVTWARSGEAGCPIYLWPCAVGRETGTVGFAGQQGAASRPDPGGGNAVLCVALDDVLPDFPASLVKLDIEGAEPEALASAARLIRRCRPRLAVCVYHRPDHLWTIPRLVRELGPAYDLHLRLHRFNGFDLVLYAIPRP